MIIDLGNVWDALSAFGTIAVVIVSLYLARRDYRKKLEVDYWISYKIFSGEKISLWSIDLVNIGSVPVKIYEVGLYQKSWLRKRRKKIIFMMPRDFEYESAKLPILLNPQEDATYFIAKNEWITKIKELGINQRKIGLYARDTTGTYYYRKFLLE
ncbi:MULTISPECIES: hypothetical protein [Lactococcus]|jgi:hypothetical protein|uniref:hypothetical protein n=1 Tax=Lactococcus TaxID=1357 RepID=UPI00024D8E15|nr:MULTISPECIES: hypothetical protein [Lactococcus]MCA2381505.1 hypothetical protein [Lactococcus sp. SK2-659]MCI2095177.1 hypothetical protein [Lactococcus lactis]MCI2139562.1 hypothetical protein [Lactococcus lactis]MCI2190090.1 hypothetical protein [Lactococcus lactis]BAL51518.1 unknown protein [Lactococcus lactis subsp. lactis IO-1]